MTSISRIVAAGLLWAGLLGAPSEPAATVTMTNQLGFEPDTIRISVNETVEWRNTSDLVHTVTADPSRAASPESVRRPEGAGTFDSGRMKPGATFSRTFEVPGTYRYLCVPHEAAGMVGVLIVSGS